MPYEGQGEIAGSSAGFRAKRSENVAPGGLLYQVAPVP
jgi:hypothetical protein